MSSILLGCFKGVNVLRVNSTEAFTKAVRPFLLRRSLFFLVVIIIESIQLSLSEAQIEDAKAVQIQPPQQTNAIIGLAIFTLTLTALGFLVALYAAIRPNTASLTILVVLMALKSVSAFALFFTLIGLYGGWILEFNFGLIASLLFGLVYALYTYVTFGLLRAYQTLHGAKEASKAAAVV
uniref:Uncharacterized protein n=1 Tax=Mucochytrium quahogii TaxID=96639 RepID=A0A7S2SLD5_9STRA|mmetsp:Transcript_7709/g.16866  ORF Transcript_7709/g.16866 Transcript_7709/m.16866 type:complete len:180 (+) Transcript_7709:82-621(+)